MDPYRASSNVRYRIVDGLVVLLDVRAGEYLILDRVATAMWRALLSQAPNDRVPAIAAAFGVPEERIGADLRAFAQRCSEQGFLEPGVEAETEPVVQESKAVRPPARFLTLKAWWALMRTAQLLRTDGFGATYRRYAAIASPPAQARSPGMLSRAERAFARAENFFFTRNAPRDCLPRSLALFRFPAPRRYPGDALHRRKALSVRGPCVGAERRSSALRCSGLRPRLCRSRPSLT